VTVPAPAPWTRIQTRVGIACVLAADACAIDVNEGSVHGDRPTRDARCQKQWRIL